MADGVFGSWSGGPPGDALSSLRYRLQRLHRETGERSTRLISLDTGKEISHTTIARLLRCEELPKWGALEPLVKALGGDEGQFRKLWVAARDQRVPLALPPGVTEPEDWGPDPSFARQVVTLADADVAEEDLDKRTDAQLKEEESLRVQLLKSREELADLGDQLAELQHRATTDRDVRRQLQLQIADLETERDLLRGQIDQLRTSLRRSREEMIDLLEQRVQLATRRSELYYEWARSEELRGRRVQPGA